MNILNNTFHRLFSLNMYKTHKLKLGKLSFSKDFINTDRGDLYPLLSQSNDLYEYVKENTYYIESGKSERLMGQFFPYATYEISFKLNKGKTGFGFYIKDAKATVLYNGVCLSFTDGVKSEIFTPAYPIDKLIVSLRPGAFDIYHIVNNFAEYICTFKSDLFNRSAYYDEFKSGYVSFVAEGVAEIKEGVFYIDSGVSLADIRPVTYEDGTVILENGKIFLTASIRMQEETFQGVFSWVPGTCEFNLEGAIFYDAGDGMWGNDVAASLIYNRLKNKWLLWVCSFSHNHILAHSEFDFDIRFGVNVLDITLMDTGAQSEDSSFLGKEGDEDPALIFDKKNNRWLMAICRLIGDTKKYRYMFYESDNPLSDFKFIGQGFEGEETGGSFVNIEDEIVFICGNSFKEKSNYRVYTKDGMKNLKFDFCDGGFRGWGTVIPIGKGTRKEYYHLTFDRHLGSSYNWSYGNIYCYKIIN